MDRYYRAREGDDTTDHLYDRIYNLNDCNYVGLNEFLLPELLDLTENKNILILKERKRIKGNINKRGPLHNLMLTTKDKDSASDRRAMIDKLLKTHFVLLKYPLLTNPEPKWDVDYISCERRDIRKQTKSLYLSMTTGYYHFKKGDEKKIERLRKFGPRPELLDSWTKDMEKSWEVYRALKPKTAQTVFMEDFEDLKPFEILEMIGIMDWGKYLDKNFDVPIRKAWTR
tara:strand:- start:482 stop:1165 length:684 start_codon:yes stop_codon:yes gene_type:complete